ncbi:Yolk polypeptide 2 [Operophtera brumata]|uniref:Lipase n=1 Tax=Operophtera brumata TaxID=104452 RepID=A0A0L7LE30_OPEBR|nr:Yolk polypeptide 2 [Operophtera brumata]
MKVHTDVEPSLGKSMTWRGLKKVANPDAPVQKELQMIFADAQKAMKHPTAVEKARFHEAYTIAAEKTDEDAHLNATEMLKKYEYPVEEHTVQTDDGYFLTLFRIKKQQISDETAKPVVFLMHGLLGSADDWLLMGPGKSLAYLLADAGYDVWLGNARGNKYSRRHASKHPAMNDYWLFSTDQIALHDVPAMMDYALTTSGQEKLHYVGHALGTTAFFALAASYPAYNEKIISMHALSPMAYMTHARSPLMRMVAPTSYFEARLRHLVGHGAFEPSKELIASIGGDMCLAEIGCKNVCSNVNFVMSGISIEGVDAAQAAVVVAHLPAGGSIRTIKQYGQAVASGEFRKYDYGPTVNSQVYGTVEPPKYNMSRVTAPVTLYSAAEDWLAHPADVTRLQAELPHSEYYEVPEPHFAHMDFQFSPQATELVYKKLINSLSSY